MHNGHDLDRAREALHAVPPDLPHDDWVRVGMGAHAAGLAFDDFNNWSAGADTYNERVARDTWLSFKPGGGIGAGTLFEVAKQHGHRQGAVNKLHRTRPRPPTTRPGEAPQTARPGMGAHEVWERCKPATTAHGYIEAKAGIPEGLRVVPEGDLLLVAGQRMAGALVVPVTPLAGGEPVSLLFIASPDMAARWKAARLRTSKLNLPDAPMAGVFVVGDMPRKVVNNEVPRFKARSQLLFDV